MLECMQTKYQLTENSIKGVFDGAFGTLFLNSKDIDKFNIKEEDNPYLFLAIEMTDLIPMYSNGISMEVSILREQSESEQDFCVPESVYLNGKLSNSHSFIYKLKTDPSNPFMNVEFSSNSDLVKWDLAYDKNLEKLILANKQYLNGRYIMTFEVDSQILLEKKSVYLVVHNDRLNKISPKLGNYVFKYMNGKANDSFNYFPQEKNLLEYSISSNSKGKIYSISFYPIEQFDVNYYIKSIYKDTKINGEREDTIAISESEGYYLQIDNPKFDGEKANLIFEIPNNREISYIKVLALVKFYSIKEYLLYKPCDITNSSDTRSEHKNINNTLIWIIVGTSGGLFIVIIIIIIIIVIYNSNKKDLLEKVNKVSFVGSDEKEKDDNLLIDDKNELE